MGYFFILVAVCVILAYREQGHRHRLSHRDRRYVTELEQVVEDQRLHMESLEERVVRLEEGLEFAERVLAQREPGAGGLMPLAGEAAEGVYRRGAEDAEGARVE